MPPASLTVVKNDTTDSNTSFGFTSTPTPPLSSFNLQDPSNKTKTFASIPAGSYSVTEDNKDGWTLDSVVCTSTLNSSTFTYSGRTANITLQPGDSATCTYTNSPIIPDVGRIKIIKTVDAGGSSFTSGTFEVTASCGEAGTFVKDIMYPAPGFIEIGDLPTGTECTVTETDKPTPPSDYSWGSEVITGSPATVTFQGTATVTVANKLTRDLGSLEITKTLDVGGSNFDTTTTFAIGYECTLAGVVTKSGTANLAKDGVATITGIPTGSVCTVTEPAFPGCSDRLQLVEDDHRLADGCHHQGRHRPRSRSRTSSPVTSVRWRSRRRWTSVARTSTPPRRSRSATNARSPASSRSPARRTSPRTGWRPSPASRPRDRSATVTEPAFPVCSDRLQLVEDDHRLADGCHHQGRPTYAPRWVLDRPAREDDHRSPRCHAAGLGITAWTSHRDPAPGVTDAGRRWLELRHHHDVRRSATKCTLAGVVTKSGTANLAKDGVATITGIPTGSVCTVTEPAFPGAPTGYSWSKTITGSPTAAITKDGTEPRSRSRTSSPVTSVRWRSRRSSTRRRQVSPASSRSRWTVTLTPSTRP